VSGLRGGRCSSSSTRMQSDRASGSESPGIKNRPTEICRSPPCDSRPPHWTVVSTHDVLGASPFLKVRVLEQRTKMALLRSNRRKRTFAVGVALPTSSVAFCANTTNGGLTK
jgi:hypothetical protein